MSDTKDDPNWTMHEENLRPDKFTMAIEGTILEALGVNLYSTIAKCLVEFAANAFDSDAKWINITIPFEEITVARKDLREAAKKKSPKTGEKRKPLVISDPLPEAISIVIEDDGHGMNASEIQEKFLPLNRNRRAGSRATPPSNKTESNNRFVMGRKGLGKLAAFGVAQRVTVRSKRKGDSYASEFTMDYDEIKDSKLHEVPFIPRYEDGLPTEEHGTRITLECLRCDSVSAGKGGVSSSIRDNFFGIEESEFAIQINGNSLEHDEPIIEFTYPEDRGSNDLSELEVTIPEDMGSFPIFLKATFRASVEGNDHIYRERSVEQESTAMVG